jgi:hypothetical protein
MNKREKLERAREIQEVFTFGEIPKDQRAAMFKAEDDYRYVRITVEDIDTGELVAPQVYTFRKRTEDYHIFLDAIKKIAKWPDEILDSIKWKEFVFAGGERLQADNLTARKLHDRRWLSEGRPTNYDDYGKQWEASGWDRKVKRALKEKYLTDNIDDNADERFDRAMRRYKQRRTKRE